MTAEIDATLISVCVSSSIFTKPQDILFLFFLATLPLLNNVQNNTLYCKLSIVIRTELLQNTLIKVQLGNCGSIYHQSAISPLLL